MANLSSLAAVRERRGCPPPDGRAEPLLYPDRTFERLLTVDSHGTCGNSVMRGTQRSKIAYRRAVLGWNIGVYRLPNLDALRDGEPDAQVLLLAADAPGDRIAIWQTGLGGCDWIEELAAEGRAVDLGGNGYPSRYAATAAVLLPPILAGPPHANTHWSYGVGDILGPNWEGKTTINAHLAAACAPDEWLVVEAWDES